MPIILLRKNLLVFLLLFMTMFLPKISHAKEVTSSQLKDIIRAKGEQVVAVIFLTTENHFYREHLPELNSIYKKHKKNNVEIIGVLLNGTAKETKDSTGIKGVNFPSFIARDNEEMRYIFHVKKIPLVLYYKNGELVYKEEGYEEPEHLEKDLYNFLEGLKPHETK